MKVKTINLLPPYPAQAGIEHDPHRFRVLACGRRWGKSNMAMREAFQMLLRAYEIDGKPHRGWIVSPTFPLVREDWLIAEDLLKDAITKKSTTDMRMDFKPFGFMEFKSADRDDEGLRGAGLDFCVVDEASRVSRKAWEQGIRPALSDKLGRAIFISTPKGRNWFYELWVKGQTENPDIKSWKYSTFDNPFFPESEKKVLTDSTPEMILLQEYYADFLEDEATVFRNLEKCLKGELQGNNDKERYSIGVDLGKAEDFTVITVVKESTGEIVYVNRFNKIDWSLQKEHIKAVCKVYRRNIVHIDSTGLGSPIVEDLSKAGLVVRGFIFTNTSKQILIEQLVVAIEQKLLSIPNVLETRFLIEELKCFSYELLPSGKLRYEAPEGLHDDGVISLALAIRGMSYALYKQNEEQKINLPRMSPAWLERKSFEEEIKHNMGLPRRLRREPAGLAFS
jgi:hypothetical protein